MSIEFSEKYLSTAQAARILKVAADTVKRYCNAHPPKIKAEKVGRDWLIPKSSVDKYISEVRDTGRPKHVQRNHKRNGKR